MNTVKYFCILSGVVLCLFVCSAEAALRPYLVTGIIADIDYGNSVIKIDTGEDSISGIAPNMFSVNELEKKDHVIAVSLGKEGGNWVFVAKIKKDADNIVSACYGDISFIKSAGCIAPEGGSSPCELELQGGFRVSYVNTPDCSECRGCNCIASETAVTITNAENEEVQFSLLPGEKKILPRDGWEIAIYFISGEAASYPVCFDKPLTGPQPVSNFVLKVDPADSATQNKSNNGGCFITP